MQCRAYNKRIRIDARIADLLHRDNDRTAKFNKRYAELTDDRDAAQAELDQFTGEKPSSLDVSTD